MTSDLKIANFLRLYSGKIMSGTISMVDIVYRNGCVIENVPETISAGE